MKSIDCTKTIFLRGGRLVTATARAADLPRTGKCGNTEAFCFLHLYAWDQKFYFILRCFNLESISRSMLINNYY